MPDHMAGTLSDKFPSYRYKQICDWLYRKLVFDPAQMSNIPKDLQAFLLDSYSFNLPEIDATHEARDSTIKYRLKLRDGAFIEMVLIPAESKLTLCVSSQIGCSRACAFCATGKMGLSRNLEVHEIVGQIMLASELIAPARLSNLVFMGMGEPLDNLCNVLKSLKILQAEQGVAFSPRRTTVSTCGIPHKIRELADSGVKTKLAVSLNSAIDEKRDILMPVNKMHPVRELKQAISYYLSRSSFRVTFEYILIPGINMGDEDIKALKRFVGDLSCKINFIPYNRVEHLPYQSPSEREINEFLQKAASLHQAITLRRSRGSDVCGACGQLAAQKGEPNEKH